MIKRFIKSEIVKGKNIREVKKKKQNPGILAEDSFKEGILSWKWNGRDAGFQENVYTISTEQY